VAKLAAEVAAAPDDIELQRVYADALLGQGGEHAIRGELVTLALSGKSPKMTEPRRIKLAKQLEQILADDDLDQRVIGGFVGAWACTTDVLRERGDAVFADEPLLRELEIRLNARDNETQVASIAAMPQLARVRRLTLVGHPQRTGRLPAELLQRLLASPHWPRLEALALPNCSIGDGGLRLLADARSMRELRELDLTKNEIRAKGIEALAKSPHLGELRRLVLTHNRPGVEGVRALARSVHVTKLEHVDVSFTMLLAYHTTELSQRFPGAVYHNY
jgi:hypothetical protein